MKYFRIVKTDDDKFRVQQKGWFFWRDVEGVGGTWQAALPIEFDTLDEAKSWLADYRERSRVASGKARVVHEERWAEDFELAPYRESEMRP